MRRSLALVIVLTACGDDGAVPGGAVRRRRDECFFGRRGSRAARGFRRVGVDVDEHRTDRDRVAFGAVKRGDDAGHRGRHLRIDLIRRHFDEHPVMRDIGIDTLDLHFASSGRG